MVGSPVPIVDELPDAVLGRESVHHPDQVLTVVDGQPAGAWHDLVQPHASDPVGLKVVVAAQVIVVHAGHMGLARVDAG